jgi:hypothetical protein
MTDNQSLFSKATSWGFPGEDAAPSRPSTSVKVQQTCSQDIFLFEVGGGSPTICQSAAGRLPLFKFPAQVEEQSGNPARDLNLVVHGVESDDEAPETKRRQIRGNAPGPFSGADEIEVTVLTEKHDELYEIVVAKIDELLDLTMGTPTSFTPEMQILWECVVKAVNTQELSTEDEKRVKGVIEELKFDEEVVGESK